MQNLAVQKMVLRIVHTGCAALRCGDATQRSVSGVNELLDAKPHCKTIKRSTCDTVHGVSL